MRVWADTPDTADVSGVSRAGGMVASDKADTAWEMQTYQAKPAFSLACTGDTAETVGNTNADTQTTESCSSSTQIEPNGLHSRLGSWLADKKKSAARAYHAHHFFCQTCIAAGHGNRYDRICVIGQALWNTCLGS
jgi:hypothetical protein